MTPKKSVWAKAHASVGAAQDAIRKLPPNTYGLRRDNLALIEGMRELVTVMQDLLANMYDRGSQPGLSHGKNLERQEIKQEEEDHQQEGEDHQQQEKNQQQQEEQDEGEIPVPVLQHRQTKRPKRVRADASKRARKKACRSAETVADSDDSSTPQETYLTWQALSSVLDAAEFPGGAYTVVLKKLEELTGFSTTEQEGQAIDDQTLVPAVYSGMHVAIAMAEVIVRHAHPAEIQDVLFRLKAGHRAAGVGHSDHNVHLAVLNVVRGIYFASHDAINTAIENLGFFHIISDPTDSVGCLSPDIQIKDQDRLTRRLIENDLTMLKLASNNAVQSAWIDIMIKMRAIAFEYEHRNLPNPKLWEMRAFADSQDANSTRDGDLKALTRDHQQAWAKWQKDFSCRKSGRSRFYILYCQLGPGVLLEPGLSPRILEAHKPRIKAREFHEAIAPRLPRECTPHAPEGTSFLAAHQAAVIHALLSIVKHVYGVQSADTVHQFLRDTAHLVDIPSYPWHVEI